MSFNFTIIYLIASVLITLCICVFAWKQTQTHGSKAFAISCLASVFWMTGDIIGRVFSDFPTQFFAELIRYIGVTSIPVAVFTFTRQYCGKDISRKQILLLSIIPAISYVMVATSLWHNLFFATMSISETNSLRVSFGPYFWFVHTPYSYLLILTSIFLVALEIRRVSKNFRLQVIYLLISLNIPLIINVLGLSGVFNGANYTPLSFSAFLVVMAIGMFRHKLLWSNPIVYESVFKTMKDGVIIFDRDYIIRDINPAAAKSLNKPAKKVIGQDIRKIFAFRQDLVEKYADKLEFYDEVEIKFGEKLRHIAITLSPIKTKNGKINGRIATFRDITAHKEHQSSLEMLAFHDPLTRTANRRKFQQEVEIAIKDSAETKKSFAILFFDLNRFKAVNDTLGHEIGDELLKFVAARVASLLRGPDLLARMGGDEFAILLHNTNIQETEAVVARILENVQNPFVVDNHTLTAELSIGAALYPNDGESLTQLLKNADSAMYFAKSKGGGFALFEPKKKFKKNAA